MVVSLVGKNLGEAWIFFGVVWWLNAFLIHRTSERASWARYCLLGLTITGLALQLPASGEDLELTTWGWAETTATLLMETLALIWLFFGEGGKWFRKSVAAG